MFEVPIRGFHLGQQSTRLHQQAGHMTASDQIGTSTHKHLASRGPSTYGSRVAPLRGPPGMTVRVIITCPA
jgi:hypothetical protein